MDLKPGWYVYRDTKIYFIGLSEQGGHVFKNATGCLFEWCDGEVGRVTLTPYVPPRTLATAARELCAELKKGTAATSRVVQPLLDEIEKLCEEAGP